MKYKILRTDGDYDFINDSVAIELPENAIELNDEQWANRFQSDSVQLLDNMKINKKSQLKANRDAANLRPMISIQADEVLYSEGEETRTSNKKYFAFSVTETGQPATSPSSIIFSTLLASSVNPAYFLRYSCFIIEGGSTRKGYVAIDAVVASTILNHISHRATTNIAYANEIESLINSANSIEELEEINIEF